MLTLKMHRDPLLHLRETAAGKLPAPMDAPDCTKPGTEARDGDLTSPTCEFSFKEENRERTQLHSLKDASIFHLRKTSLATFAIWKDLSNERKLSMAVRHHHSLIGKLLFYALMFEWVIQG